MALLGMLSGVGQASGAQRLPVTMGQVFGSLAGGAMQGAAAGQQGQLREQEATKGAISNAAALNALAQQAAAWGQPAPTRQSVLAGQPLMDWTKIFAGGLPGDRKSTRLNSSHANISYAVFCLKKKTAETRHWPPMKPRRESR